MKQLKISQNDFNELCCNGRLHFVHHDVFMIYWKTFFKHIAVSVQIESEEAEVIELVVE